MNRDLAIALVVDAGGLKLWQTPVVGVRELVLVRKNAAAAHLGIEGVNDILSTLVFTVPLDNSNNSTERAPQ